MNNLKVNKNTKKVGDQGEMIARKYLRNDGHVIIEQNFWRKFGELDIITRKGRIIHFVEVKSVSHETRKDLETSVATGIWRPEENVHAHKLERMYRTIETWLSSNNYVGEWQIDVVAVRFVTREKFASVKLIENIVV